ncbi:hypothetical protein SPRG_09798 [Saprolegnia parasitica CBS 223.65]|uniref:CBM1 domain-containing protein n=1 Tax=Saprolegnia parasitica (strain CBS 223.65) TaxID=695850 RepID=A0A067C0T7_SAPPC|nr:hypothetical protein SPRG_09798 [Saprolegnia parasitica CBS 223.65]KDO24409.1 hypothetical protein SPRG_09798 [Saprolegnia parasitica CBS 223.65]|eukprot:XP_012204839.1 hypothetical protein SPRG_09798 [Saprolegnia parasitica CBS 223.65]
MQLLFLSTLLAAFSLQAAAADPAPIGEWLQCVHLVNIYYLQCQPKLTQAATVPRYDQCGGIGWTGLTCLPTCTVPMRRLRLP